jgi:hypothetical protein
MWLHVVCTDFLKESVACITTVLEWGSCWLWTVGAHPPHYTMLHPQRNKFSFQGIFRWAGHVARLGEGRGVHRVLVGNPEGKRPLVRPRRRWEDNIKMDLREVGGGCGDWMEYRDRWRALVSTVRNLRVPKIWGISWLAAEPVSFSRRTLLRGVSK